MRCSKDREGSNVDMYYLYATEKGRKMSTELHDAWPDEYPQTPEEDLDHPGGHPGGDRLGKSHGGSGRGASCRGEACRGEVSARKVLQDGSPVVGVDELLDELRREQAQRFMVFTLIVTVLLLSQMSQLDSLKREIRRLTAVVSATGPSSAAAPTPWRY